MSEMELGNIIFGHSGGEIKAAYSKALTRTDAAKVVKSKLCAFRVRVIVEKMPLE